MDGPFLRPFAHLSFDDPGVDAVASRLDDFLGNLLHQQAIPALTATLAGRTLGQATAQNLERGGKRYTPGIDLLRSGRLLHQHP